MALDNPVVMTILLGSVLVLILGIILRILKLPSIIAYILTGVVIGPYWLKWVNDVNAISLLGEIGIVLLLFFIGMEISFKDLFSNWKLAVYGTGLQILFSTLAVAISAIFFGFGFKTIIVIGFMISLSSTAVLIKILEDRQDLEKKRGQNILSILLIQDIAIVPMLVIITWLGSKEFSSANVIRQLIGATLFIIMANVLLREKELRLPFFSRFKKDPELQVFASFIACFALAGLATYFHLSSALGAFLAGLIISKSKDISWIQENLHAFRVIFVALFFVSVGMLLNIPLIKSNLVLILFVVFLILAVNTWINAYIFFKFGESRKESILCGAMMSQIGEFSFIIASLAFSLNLLENFEYQVMITAIVLTLIISPFWIILFDKLVNREIVKKRNIWK